ncbi:uncharacterized protein BXZ73DRAFT_49300, partial [Epithele typhae]|uniref:uncharacterized protein n=1 Tax=Epithele typhae TaxID=378194 RepID=UPI002008868C
NPWKCPHCPFIQHSRRTPDLKRHIATHGQPDVVWTCRGVPLRYAEDPKYTGMAVPMEEVQAAVECGRTMVGGCMKEFSRKDALTRHLKNRQLSCAGRQAVEEWHCVEN